MTEFRKLMRIMEESPYDNRVHQIANQVISAHETTPFTNTHEIHDFINNVAKDVVDYRMGGDSRRDFVKDVITALKGKIKKPRTPAPVKPINDKKFLSRVAQKINDAISTSFPDSDPFPYLVNLFKHMNIEPYEIKPYLDKAAKLNGYKSYDDQLEKSWDELSTMNPDNSKNSSKEPNPWRSQ